jgi:hypothetical protein
MWHGNLSSDGAEQWYPRSLFKVNSEIYLGVTLKTVNLLETTRSKRGAHNFIVT